MGKGFSFIVLLLCVACSPDYLAVKKTLDKNPTVLVIYQGPGEIFGKDDEGKPINFATVFTEEFKKFYPKMSIELTIGVYDLIAENSNPDLNPKEPAPWHIPLWVRDYRKDYFERREVYDTKKKKYRAVWENAFITNDNYDFVKIRELSQKKPVGNFLVVPVIAFTHEYLVEQFNKKDRRDKFESKLYLMCRGFFVDGVTGKLIGESKGFELFKELSGKRYTNEDRDILEAFFDVNKVKSKKYNLPKDQILKVFRKEVMELLKEILNAKEMKPEEVRQ